LGFANRWIFKNFIYNLNNSPPSAQLSPGLQDKRLKEI